MKQLILTLLIAVSAFTVSAQRDYRNDDRDERYHYKYDGGRRYDLHDNPRNKREFKRQLAIINRDYHTRIEYIKRHPHMRRREKARKIHELEIQRRIALDHCRDRYAGKRQRDYARDRRYDNDKW